MGMHQIHQLSEMIEEITNPSNALSPLDILVVDSERYRSINEIGIHLHSPNMRELQDAIETAIRDGFPRILLYTDLLDAHELALRLMDAGYKTYYRGPGLLSLEY